MSDPTYPLFPICAFLGFVLVLVPLPWHLQARNTATGYFMIWTALACLNQFVNSVVWHGNVINHSPIWCDISTRIMLGATIGIPASCLSINRRLFTYSNMKVVSVSRSMKNRDLLIDTGICLVFPLICIALAFVVQGHRFDIYEDIGCFPVIYNTLPAYFLVFMWPVLIGLVSFTFAALSIRAFAHKRAEFGQFLSSNTSLTMGRYLRLMALAMTEICCTTPLAVLAVVLNLQAPLEPWISWQDTHFDFGRIGQYPGVVWRTGTLVEAQMEMTRWLLPFCALVFLGFFGFAEEARKSYAKVYARVLKALHIVPTQRRPMYQATSGFSPASSKFSPASSKFSPSSTTALNSLPMYNHSLPSPPPIYGSKQMFSTGTSDVHDVEKGAFASNHVGDESRISLASSTYATASASRASFSTSLNEGVPMSISDARPISIHEPLPTPIHDRMTQA